MFIISVLPFLLGQILPVEIKVDETNTFINKPIYAEVILKNPYPIPVWYSGCEWISLEVYPSGSTRPDNETFAVTKVAGGKLGSGLILPWKESIIYSRRFLIEDTGSFNIFLRMKEEARIIERTMTINVIE